MKVYKLAFPSCCGAIILQKTTTRKDKVGYYKAYELEDIIAQMKSKSSSYYDGNAYGGGAIFMEAITLRDRVTLKKAGFKKYGNKGRTWIMALILRPAKVKPKKEK